MPLGAVSGSEGLWNGAPPVTPKAEDISLPEETLHCGVSSFGSGGTNSHAVLCRSTAQVALLRLTSMQLLLLARGRQKAFENTNFEGQESF